MPTPVIVIAKVPGLDMDLGRPKDAVDKMRIDAHGEYYLFREDSTLNQIEIGSVVWVTYDKDYN